MADSADSHEFRIRISGTNDPHQDNEHLKAWLEREPWLAQQQHEWDRRERAAHETDTTDEPDLGPMAGGVVNDLILVIVGSVTGEITKSLTIAVKEWLQRRWSARADREHPEVSVVPPDSGGPASGSNTREG